ncbi:MAG: hypothetical protein WBB01_21980 [Phormidesmis sp.]
MEIQQRISQQRVKHIVDSYCLAGAETDAFQTYLSELLSQYPHGLIELALVETLVKNWLIIPMQKGIPFLAAAHNRLKQWRAEPVGTVLTSSLSPGQFSHITGLDPQAAFTALSQVTALPTQSATE